MRRKEDSNDVAFCILLLQTACGKLHRLIKHNDTVFLCDERGVHTSYRSVNPDKEFCVREYFYDPAIPVNIEELHALAHTYLSEHGSKGKVGTAGVTHNWFTTGHSDDDSDGSEEEIEDEEDEDGIVATKPASKNSPTTSHASYTLAYIEPCPIEHMHGDGKAHFYNNIQGLPKKGRITKKALIGLGLGTNVAVKRYSNFTKDRRFVFAGNLVVLARGSTHKSTRRTVYPLM
jgi:hypothetical protein